MDHMRPQRKHPWATTFHLVNKRLIIISGPTASGKSELAVQLSLKLDAQILSADSRQVYKELNIGVAKPTSTQLATIPHHLVSYVSIHEKYSAGHWARDARKVIETSFGAEGPVESRHISTPDTLIIAGGSGLHVQSLLEGIPQMPDVPPAVRQAYEEKFATHGIAALQEELRVQDPAYFEIVDQQNAHRLQRALCAIAASGKTFTALRNAPRQPLPYPASWVILEPNREQLYARINQRVDDMVASGLEEEARELYPLRSLDALQTIGYREWWPYFEGVCNRDAAIEKIKQASRQYARRQLTWNRRLEGLHINSPDPTAILTHLNSTK
jgi:tRNA dimethylallyltransferase